MNRDTTLALVTVLQLTQWGIKCDSLTREKADSPAQIDKRRIGSGFRIGETVRCIHSFCRIEVILEERSRSEKRLPIVERDEFTP